MAVPTILMRIQKGIIDLIIAHKQDVILSFINTVLQSYVTRNYRHNTTRSKTKILTVLKKRSLRLAHQPLYTMECIISILLQPCISNTLFGDSITRCKKNAYAMLWELCSIRMHNFALTIPIQLKKQGFGMSAFAQEVYMVHDCRVTKSPSSQLLREEQNAVRQLILWHKACNWDREQWIHVPQFPLCPHRSQCLPLGTLRKNYVQILCIRA